MKKIILFLTLILFGCSKEDTKESTNVDIPDKNAKHINTNTNNSHLDTNTLKGFSKAVINTWKDNDIPGFTKYLLTKDKAIATLESVNLDIEKWLRKLGRIPRKKQINNWFYEVVDGAVEDKINIKNIQYKSIEYKIEDDHNIQYAKIAVKVLYNNVAYYIKLDGCIKTPSGWVMGDDPSWEGTELSRHFW